MFLSNYSVPTYSAQNPYEWKNKKNIKIIDIFAVRRKIWIEYERNVPLFVINNV